MAGEARSQPGVCRGSAMRPMMGDTPSGVVARRTCPSGVASFKRVTHAPADPRALHREMVRLTLHSSRSPRVGSWMVRAGAAGGGWRRGPRGLLPRRVLQRFVEQSIDEDGVVVLAVVDGPVFLQRQVPAVQDVLDGAPDPVLGEGLQRIETVQKTAECPQLPFSWEVVQYLDKVVDMPVGVLRQGCRDSAETAEVPQLQFIDKGFLRRKFGGE